VKTLTIGERIKQVRKANHLTQQEFADKIGSKRNTIATYEVGRTLPSSAVVSLICTKFQISEKWLKTGEEPMYVQQTEKEAIAAAVERLMTGETTDFKRHLIDILSKLEDEQWLLLEKTLQEIVSGQKVIPILSSVSQEPPAAPQANPQSEIAELRRQVQKLTAKIETLEQEDELQNP